MKFSNRSKFIAAIVLLIVSFLLDDIFSSFSVIIQNSYFDHIMLWLSNLITVFFVLLVLSAFFLYEENKTKYIPLLYMSFIAATAISYVLKIFFMRERPDGLHEVILGLTDYSFPSTHAAASFSVLPILDKEFPRVKIFWIIFAVLVMVSRIYLNRHYLSDVMAGAALGYMTGQVIIKLDEKYEISKIFG